MWRRCREARCAWLTTAGTGCGFLHPARRRSTPFKPSYTTYSGDALFASDSHRVMKLVLSGDRLHRAWVHPRVDVDPTVDVQFNTPAGLCVVANTLYVCDKYNHRIVALDSTDLAWRYSFGQRGVGPGEFSYPQGIVAHEDELFVSCSSGHRVQVFELGADGLAFRRSFGKFGDAPGEFKGPVGLAVVRNLLVVSETANMRVQVLSLQGAPLQQLKFNSWLGGACARGNRVWVVQRGLQQFANRSFSDRVHVLAVIGSEEARVEEEEHRARRAHRVELEEEGEESEEWDGDAVNMREWDDTEGSEDEGYHL